jgi:aldehyde dehydrogenase (NAD+)
MENPTANFQSLLLSLKAYQESGQTKSRASRLDALHRLEKLIRENMDSICQALYEDLHKPKQEALISEVAVVLEELSVFKRRLKKWMRPKCVKSPLALWPSQSQVHFEPLGVVLIIGPWNYPFQLLFSPLIGALAAGNCAVLKPSELTPKTSHLIETLVKKYFNSDLLQVVLGGVPETTELLKLKFDHIFFTGSTPVGKIVMQAAAKNLVPVTLELGGKSPAIVCEDADLDLAARRIVWGKFYNAGQTCVAPDYVYVHESVADVFTQKVKTNIAAQFGANPVDSKDFARIVNVRNTERLASLLDPQKVVLGGRFDLQAKYFEPTVMQNVSCNDKIMGEEIFGPILPVLTYSNLNDAFKAIRSKPKPLAAYFFSQSQEKQKAFTSDLSFGGGCINDVVVHLSNPYLPFGGVGDSGMGHYHGEASFKTFSHAKSVMRRYGIFDLSARYAPSTDGKLKFLRWLFGI